MERAATTRRDRRHRLANRVAALTPYAGAALLLFGLQQSRIAEAVNLLLYDLVVHRQNAAVQPGPGIAIIGISEADIAALGWPIDDRYLCQAIQRLSDDGAVAIGLDLYRDQGVGPQKDCLRQQARTNPRLVSIFNVAEATGAIPGTPAQRQAFNDLVLDVDGVVRRDLVHVSGQDAATVALPLRLAELARGGDQRLRQALERGTAPGPWLDAGAGGYTQLDAAGYQQMLPFRTPGGFPQWDLHQLIRNAVPAAQLRGRIVLIGSTAPSLKDLFLVPHSRFGSGERQTQMTGVEIHANRTAAALRRMAGTAAPMQAWPGWSGQLLLVLSLGLGVLLGESFSRLRESILSVAALELVALGGAVLLLIQGHWVNTSLPMAGLGLMAGAAWLRRGSASQQQRQQIEKLLGQTTSPAVAKQLWAQRDSLLRDGRFEGQLLPVTVVFSDTCNFTTVSEQLAPADLLAWLNRGMAVCVPAITRRGGMVNKFTGDGFLAVFGAPLSNGTETDARAAIAAALEIQQGIERLNTELAAEGAPKMGLRIGVHSGNVLAGSMGSSERLEYAVIGDSVNCASRLESLDRTRQTNICRILASSETRALLDDTDPPLCWESWGPLTVKGRAQPLDVWELRGSAQESVPATPAP
ncbi:CHASE2 domain-containing protein [Vulcanococcus limneticus]|uniref:CHASE2 domain-containing protein n=1 Tax=Vulcanococcus limneticus TaxID=2170428 RepID=UPI00398BFF14